MFTCPKCETEINQRLFLTLPIDTLTEMIPSHTPTPYIVPLTDGVGLLCEKRQIRMVCENSDAAEEIAELIAANE